MSRRDEAIARRQNERTAAAAPLLAWAGLTPTVTAEDVATRRERNRVAAEAHMEAQQAWESTTLAAMQAELATLATPEAIREWLDTSKAGQPGYVPLYVGISGALTRARAGLPLSEPQPTVYSDRPRRPVAVPAIVAALEAMGGRATVSALCDRMACGVGILDAVAALYAARDAGLVRGVPGGRGWELCRCPPPKNNHPAR